jgi:hypothetical protein
MRNPSRREFLKGVAAAAGAVVLGEGCAVEPTPEGREGREEKEYVEPADIENFRDLSGGVLVITANEAEEIGVMDTLKVRSDGRPEDKKFKFDKRGVLNRAIVSANPMDRGLDEGQNVPVEGGQGEVQLIEGMEENQRVPIVIANSEDWGNEDLQKRIGDEHFAMIQLRGHEGDMARLYELAKDKMNEHTILLLGGCHGAQMIPELYDSKQPIIADTGTGETGVNTYILLRVIDEIGTSENWEDLHVRLETYADLGTLGIVDPGGPGYEQLAKR